MTLVQLEELILLSLSCLLLTLVLGMFVVWGWTLQRLIRGLPLLPQTPILRRPPARWGGMTVLMVIALYLGVNILVGYGHSALTDRHGAEPGQEKPLGEVSLEKNPNPAVEHEPATADPAIHDEDEPPTPTVEKDDALAASTRSPLEMILLTCVANLIFALLLPPLLNGFAGVRLSDLGLSGERWPLQVKLGAGAALVAIPVVYVVQYCAISIWKVREHPVQQMMTDQLTPGVAALAVLSTVILAPLIEETMFRGILQSWLARRFSGNSLVDDSSPSPSSSPSSADSAPSLVVETVDVQSESSALAQRPLDSPDSLAETLGVGLAIIVTSVLFAAMHATQWPDPIALFLFSLGLGIVYQRTGSLLAAMAMHGLFNGCSTLLLLVQQLARHVNGAPLPIPESEPTLNPAFQSLLEWIVSLYLQ